MFTRQAWYHMDMLQFKRMYELLVAKLKLDVHVFSELNLNLS